jgi:hypothetical protein
LCEFLWCAMVMFTQVSLDTNIIVSLLVPPTISKYGCY